MFTRRLVARFSLQLNAIQHRLYDFAPLLGRVTLGVLFMSTGWGKVHNLAKVAEFFAELGIPAPGFQAALVAYVELIGGGLVLLGLFAELASVPLIISMLVAIVTAKRSEVHGLPDLFGLVEWTYLVLLIWLAVNGPGKFSLSRYIARQNGKQAEVFRHAIAIESTLASEPSSAEMRVTAHRAREVGRPVPRVFPQRQSRL